MMTLEHRINAAIQLALGSDLTLGAMSKLMPTLMPVVHDHTAQTLALLALAVGVTHAMEAASSFFDHIKRVFGRKPNAEPTQEARAIQPKPIRANRRPKTSEKRAAATDAKSPTASRRVKRSSASNGKAHLKDDAAGKRRRTARKDFGGSDRHRMAEKKRSVVQ